MRAAARMGFATTGGSLDIISAIRQDDPMQLLPTLAGLAVPGQAGRLLAFDITLINTARSFLPEEKGFLCR